MIELNFQDLQCVNGGGGPIANAINATAGGVLIANSGIAAGTAVLAFGAAPLMAAGIGVALLLGGAYCLWNAFD